MEKIGDKIGNEGMVKSGHAKRVERGFEDKERE